MLLLVLVCKASWTNANELRKAVDKEKQNNPEFTIELLKAIDLDLIPLKKKILFFDLGWDSYVYSIVSQASFKTLTEKFETLFHGTEKL